MSKRRINNFNHMNIDDCVLTEEGIFGYLGSELGNGLEPNKIYQVYRPLNEIKKVVEQFNTLPIVDEHNWVGTDTTDNTDKSPKDKTIGTTGGDAKLNDKGQIINSLKIWYKDGVDLIESNIKKGLSAGYTYQIDKTPGEWNGNDYELSMKNMNVNHIALVQDPRVQNAIVQDSNFINKQKGKTMALTEEQKKQVSDDMYKSLNEILDKHDLSDEQKKETSDKIYNAMNSILNEKTKAGDDNPTEKSGENDNPTEKSGENEAKAMKKAEDRNFIQSQIEQGIEKYRKEQEEKANQLSSIQKLANNLVGNNNIGLDSNPNEAVDKLLDGVGMGHHKDKTLNEKMLVLETVSHTRNNNSVNNNQSQSVGLDSNINEFSNESVIDALNSL